MAPGSSLVLNSCAVIAHFKRNPEARTLIENAVQLFLPLAAYGELYYGALKAQRRQERLDELRLFLQIVTITYPTKQAAETYGDIRLKLALQGTPLPENDIWIAASAAKQFGVQLVTLDKHFDQIEGLNVWRL